MRKTEVEKNEIRLAWCISDKNFKILKGFGIEADIFITLYSKILKAIGKIIGLPIAITVPERLITKNVDIWGCLQTLKKLYEKNIIERWSDYPLPDLFPDEPRIVRYKIQIKPSSDVKSTQKKRALGSGYDTTSHSKALWAAIGESVERYALKNYLPKKNEYVDASYNSIKKDALNIHSLTGISPELRKKNIFNTKFNSQDIFRWVEGISLTQQKKIWIALQLVSFAGNEGVSQRNEPRLRYLVSTGAGAHTTLNDAILSGTLELIERDAFMITWVNKISPPKIDLRSVSDENLQKLFMQFTRYNLELHALYLPSDFNVHTVLSIIIDKTGVGPAVCVGASSDFSIHDAIKNAVQESLASRLGIRAKLHDMKLNVNDIQYKDVSSLGRWERLALWANPVNTNEIEFLLSSKQISVDNIEQYKIPSTSKDKVSALVEEFRKNKVELSYKEILDKETSKYIGFQSVMMVAPELQPMHLLEKLPYLDGDRMKSVPKKLNIQTFIKKNIIPHPFP